MRDPNMATLIKHKMERAARSLGVADPTPYVGELIERAFPLPAGDSKYAANALTPGAVPVEPSYSELEPQVLRFTIEPVGIGASPGTRRDGDEVSQHVRSLL